MQSTLLPGVRLLFQLSSRKNWKYYYFPGCKMLCSMIYYIKLVCFLCLYDSNGSLKPLYFRKRNCIWTSWSCLRWNQVSFTGRAFASLGDRTLFDFVLPDTLCIFFFVGAWADFSCKAWYVRFLFECCQPRADFAILLFFSNSCDSKNIGYHSCFLFDVSL